MMRWLTILFLSIAGPLWNTTANADDPIVVPELSEYEASSLDFRRALAADRRGDIDAARSGYAKALSADSLFVEAMVNLARVELTSGNPADARDWVDRALVAQPAYPAAHALAGVLSLREGTIARAIDELRSARQLAPSDVHVLTNLGAALIRSGQIAEAREVLDAALRIDPSCAEATLNLALAEDRDGEPMRAAHHYDRYLALAAQGNESVARVRLRLAEISDTGGSQSRPGVGSGLDSRTPLWRH